MFMKKLFSFITIFIISFSVAMPVFAINLGTDNMQKLGTEGGYATATNDTTLSEIIGVVIQLVLSLVGVIFLGLMVYAGYIWMTASGDQEATSKAKEIIKTS